MARGGLSHQELTLAWRAMQNEGCTEAQILFDAGKISREEAIKMEEEDEAIKMEAKQSAGTRMQAGVAAGLPLPRAKSKVRQIEEG